MKITLPDGRVLNVATEDPAEAMAAARRFVARESSERRRPANPARDLVDPAQRAMSGPRLAGDSSVELGRREGVGARQARERSAGDILQGIAPGGALSRPLLDVGLREGRREDVARTARGVGQSIGRAGEHAAREVASSPYPLDDMFRGLADAPGAIARTVSWAPGAIASAFDDVRLTSMPAPASPADRRRRVAAMRAAASPDALYETPAGSREALAGVAQGAGALAAEYTVAPYMRERGLTGVMDAAELAGDDQTYRDAARMANENAGAHAQNVAFELPGIGALGRIGRAAPMRRAGRAGRASALREEGFDASRPLYKGMGPMEGDALRPGSTGAIWFTPNRRLARAFARGPRDSVQEFFTRGNLADIDFGGRPFRQDRVVEALNKARADGFDGARIRNMVDAAHPNGADQIAIFDGANVRQRRRAGSVNLADEAAEVPLRRVAGDIPARTMRQPSAAPRQRQPIQEVPSGELDLVGDFAEPVSRSGRAANPIVPLAVPGAIAGGAGAIALGSGDAEAQEGASPEISLAQTELDALKAESELLRRAGEAGARLNAGRGKPGDTELVQEVQGRLNIPTDGDYQGQTRTSVTGRQTQLAPLIERAEGKVASLRANAAYEGAPPHGETGLWNAVLPASTIFGVALSEFAPLIGRRSAVKAAGRTLRERNREANRLVGTVTEPPRPRTVPEHIDRFFYEPEDAFTPSPPLRQPAPGLPPGVPEDQVAMNRAGALNQFWDEGLRGRPRDRAGRLPFDTQANTVTRYEANPNAASVSELYNPNPVWDNPLWRPNDVTHAALGGLDWYAMQGFLDNANRELEEARKAVAGDPENGAPPDPSKANWQRVRAAEAEVARFEALRNVGMGYTGGRIVAPVLHPYRNTRPQVGAAAGEAGRLSQYSAARQPSHSPWRPPGPFNPPPPVTPPTSAPRPAPPPASPLASPPPRPASPPRQPRTPRPPPTMEEAMRAGAIRGINAQRLPIATLRDAARSVGVDPTGMTAPQLKRALGERVATGGRRAIERLRRAGIPILGFGALAAPAVMENETPN